MITRSIIFIYIVVGIGLMPASIYAQPVLHWECYPNYHSSIRSMLDLDTAILSGSENGGMSCIDKSTYNVTYYNPCNSGLIGTRILALEKSPDSSIWIGTECGLVRWKGNNWLSYTSQNSILHSGVTAIRHHSLSGTIFIGLMTGGVIKIDSSGWNVVTGSNGTVPANRVHDIEIDLNGNLWAACRDGTGIYMFNGQNWQHFNQSNSPIFSHASSVAVDSAGIVWVANIFGLFSYNASAWTTYPGSPMSVRHISIEENNTIWLSTFSGIFVFNGSSFSNPPVNSVLSDQRLEYHLKDKGQKLWTGMQYFGVDYADGMTVIHFPLTPELDASVIKDIAFDKNQLKVWFAVGGDNKAVFLTSFDGTNWGYFNNISTPLASGNSRAVAVDSNGTVFLGTLYDGFWMKQGNTWSNFNSSNSNLLPGSIWSLHVDSLNHLLVGNSKGQINSLLMETLARSSTIPQSVPALTISYRSMPLHSGHPQIHPDSYTAISLDIPFSTLPTQAFPLILSEM